MRRDTDISQGKFDNHGNCVFKSWLTIVSSNLNLKSFMKFGKHPLVLCGDATEEP